jgi:hypothetical protein
MVFRIRGKLKNRVLVYVSSKIEIVKNYLFRGKARKFGRMGETESVKAGDGECQSDRQTNLSSNR